MPSVSKKQHNLMAAVAHNPAFAKKVGIPQSVGQDFSTADKGRKFNKGGDVKKELKAAGIFAKAGEKKLAAHERREAAGKEKDTPAIAKKEMSVLRKAKAPKDVMGYEAAEHASMGMKKGGKVKKYAEGGETFSDAFAKARRDRLKGGKDTFEWNGKKYKSYRKGEEESVRASENKQSRPAVSDEVTVSARRGKSSILDRDEDKLPRVQRKGESAADYLDPTGDKRAALRARDTDTANKLALIGGGGPGAAGVTGMAAAGAGGLNALNAAKYARDLAPIGDLIRSGKYGGYKKGGKVRKFAEGGDVSKNEIARMKYATPENTKRLQERARRLGASEASIDRATRGVIPPAKKAAEAASSDGFAKGGGIESKGKRTGKVVKMARGGGIESRGKTRGRFV